MRLKEDRKSYRARGIARKDLRHTKVALEAGKHRAKKDTKKWCGGKVGQEHRFGWEQDRRYYIGRESANVPWICICERCGKITDTWFSFSGGLYSSRERPSSLRAYFTENQIRPFRVGIF